MAYPIIVPSLENAVKISQYFNAPLEYLFMGEKADFKYHDLELAALFGEVDRMEAKYRRMVKNYIRKAIKHKNDEERLQNNHHQARFRLNEKDFNATSCSEQSCISEWTRTARRSNTVSPNRGLWYRASVERLGMFLFVFAMMISFCAPPTVTELTIHPTGRR